jgi:pimeloyl-ACP methyl ester carboxylesterase
LRRGFVDTPFGQMHYRELGTGPAVILLHQALRSSLEFRRVLPVLADDYRVIAFDLIGFGDSAGAPRQLSIEDHAVAVTITLSWAAITPAPPSCWKWLCATRMRWSASSCRGPR